MNRIFSYIKQFKWYFIVGTSFIFISIGLDMLNPRLMKVAIDEIIIGGRMELLATVLAALMGITITRAVLGYSKELLFDFGGQRVVERLRQELFAHLQSLSFSFFDKINTGELMSRIKEDVDNIFRLVCFGGMLFIEQVVYFTVATVMLFTIHWRLALVAVALMPFIAWIAFRLEAKIGVIFGKISDQGVKINTTAQENLAGVRLVKAFGREKYEILKFFTQNKENYDLRVEQAMFWGRYFPLIEFLTNLAVVLVITGGGWFVIREEISIGTLVAFSNYIYMIIWPMRMLGWLTNLLAEARASAGKIEKLFAEKPVIKEKENPVAPREIRGEIIFDRVSFEHNGRLILKDISFRVRPGGTLAIMGMTGAGKSSIINLIPRYYRSEERRVGKEGTSLSASPEHKPTTSSTSGSGVVGTGSLSSSPLPVFFFSSRRRHTRCGRDWSSDVCSSDLFEHNGRLILKDISFRVRPGGTLAIMGMTGAGKSSIINLIPRYYDCTGGTIYLDGIDIKDLPLQLLRSEVSVIMQEPFLFSNTIEENVRFGARSEER